jgi:biopolymer transport protein ExbD
MPKLKGTGGGIAKIDINMTPMIDVVFQLLAFFLMTFKIAAPEGDFNLKLPKEERSAGPANTQTEMITIRLAATQFGDLAGIQVESKPVLTGRSAYAVLHNQIVLMVNDAREAGKDEPEIQIDADDLLRYENVVRTISAIAGHMDEFGNIKPLVKKVKFKPK